MTDLEEDEIKALCVALYAADEYITVSLMNDQSKQGLTELNIINGSLTKEDFTNQWHRVITLIETLDLNEDDRNTFELIKYLYEEYGLSSTFKKELLTAILQNERFKSMAKGNFLLELMIKSHYDIELNRCEHSIDSI